MKRTRRRRTGFSVPELMIALLISAMLLLATMIALGASFHAFQSTTRTVSTTVSGRIIIERIQAMVRSGTDFGPLPASPLDSVVASNAIEIDMGDNHWITLRWDESTAPDAICGPSPTGRVDQVGLDLGLVAPRAVAPLF